LKTPINYCNSFWRRKAIVARVEAEAAEAAAQALAAEVQVEEWEDPAEGAVRAGAAEQAPEEACGKRGKPQAEAVGAEARVREVGGQERAQGQVVVAVRVRVAEVVAQAARAGVVQEEADLGAVPGEVDLVAVREEEVPAAEARQVLAEEQPSRENGLQPRHLCAAEF